MKRFQVWHYLILIFVAFWMCFAILLVTDFLFLGALAAIALLSSLVISLAWAFQNDI
ncbi:MAG TPA: hypothetical protein VFN35_36165 [Ktedonobacteraceae bacterium]|nr:hypothetical protein [Ktedonobacteraceae bacterium]